MYKNLSSPIRVAVLCGVAGALFGGGIVLLILNNMPSESVTSDVPNFNGIYNSTSHDDLEGRILNACIELQITSPECSMIYGGMNTGNGEPIT